MENPESVPKEYAIPDDAKEKGLIRIRDREGSLTKVVIEFSDNTLTTVDFDSVGNWRNNAKSALKDEGRNEELITCVMRLLNTIETAKMSAYDVAQSQKAAEEQNNNNKKDSEEGEEEEEETSLKQEVVAKYSGIYEGHPFFKDAITKHMGKPVLFESVIIRGAPYFIGLRPGEKIPIRRKIIKDELKRWQLSPYSELSHESFTFDSEAEIQQIIEQAYNLTLDDVWDRVHSWVERCYDTNDKHIINLITSHIIWTYFCDKIGITPYLFLYGDPGTGKGAILTIISLLGYRIAGMSLGSAAGVFRLLGEVEKGQVGMRIDEANNLENNIQLLETLKLGYKGNEKIPRNFDAMSAENASQKFFYAFGFKMLASEHELNPRLVGGFKTRLLSVKTAFGTPEINIEEVVSYPHKPRNKQILKELGELQKLLFAYRLIHFGDELPDLETNLNGRHRELCIGNFTLFQNTDKFETVKQAFYHVITPQITEKRDSLNVHVAILLKHLGNAKAALIKEKGGGDPRSSVISSDELLSKFQELYDKEQSKVLEGQRNNNEFYNLDPFHFKRVTFESNVIWQAMKKSINAEEIEPRPSDADEDSGSKKKKTGIGQKVLRSDIFSDIGWSWLAHALNTVGATRAPGKVEGKRGWVVDGNRLTRYERSYRRVLEEVSKYEDISVREDYSEADEIGINDGYNADSTQDTPATPPSNRQGCGTVDISNVIVDPIPASTIATITEEENGTNPHPNLSSGGVGGVAGVGGELFYDNNNNDASNQQLLLQPPKPRTSAGNGTHDTLFYGQEWIAWDLEWDPSTKKIYAAGFIDYTSRMWAVHISDPEFNGDEGKLLDKILEDIMSYPVSFGYYTTGLENAYGKGKDSDLITLHERLAANNRVSIIEIATPERGYGRRRGQFKAYCNHKHIDLEAIFSNPVVEDFIKEESEGYRSNKLKYVAPAIAGEGAGKLPGMDGIKVINEPPQVQKNYVLWDAVALYNIMTSDISRRVIDLLNELADVINAPLEWVCHTTTTSWWTKIFDDAGCTRPDLYDKPWTPHGGLNLPAKFGIYENVVAVDVNSLYPTMAIVHNIGFDTICCDCCSSDPLAKVPRYAKIYSENDRDGYFDPNMEYWICRKKPSKFREILIHLRDKKDEAHKNRQKMRKKVYKLLMNSAYGAHNAHGFAYLFPPVCDLITGFGRYTLRVMRAVALAMGYKVLAGDTDSLFILGMKTAEELESFQLRCQVILQVEDNSNLGGPKNASLVTIENKTFDMPDRVPISFDKFWCIMKKHHIVAYSGWQLRRNYHGSGQRR